MNTKNRQDQKSQREEVRQAAGLKKQGSRINLLQDLAKGHEQERIETRMTR